MGSLKPVNRLSDQEFKNYVHQKQINRMNEIDRLPPKVRTLVNEYGYTVVKTLLDLGVSKPNQIKHIVEVILDEFSPTRGSYAKQGKRTDVE